MAYQVVRCLLSNPWEASNEDQHNGSEYAEYELTYHQDGLDNKSATPTEQSKQ